MHKVVAWLAVAAALAVQPVSAATADFGREKPSSEARHVADWAVDARDHGGQPFVVIDKAQSRVFVFDRDGRITGAAPALLGLSTGDESAPGIGNRPLSSIRPEDRTTPAGRFVATLDRSLKGEEILWVDYDAAIAMHRVIATVPKERRLQRLHSRTPADRRITYGCINVPVRFFDEVVAPAFRGLGSIVYVLPEGRPAREVFKSYDVKPDASK